MKLILSRVLVAMGLALLAGHALAQQNVTINATVAKTCTVAYSATAISLTAVDSLVGATSAPVTATITCNNGTQYQYQFSDGANAGLGSRRLMATDSALPTPNSYFWNFNFESSTNGTTWSTAPLTMPLTPGVRSTGRANPMSLGLRVTIPANQDPSTAVTSAYSETILVTISAMP